MREMTEAMLMDVQRVNCWTLAGALGHSGPHRLQHFLSRAVWYHDAARDRLACWAVAGLAGDQAVLVVDETGMSSRPRTRRAPRGSIPVRWAGSVCARSPSTSPTPPRAATR